MQDPDATIADVRLFYWMLFRLNNPTAGKWILRTLGGAAVLYVALHMMPQYIDEYGAMNGTQGTIDIHHCAGHQGRTFQAWSCTGSVRTVDGYLASVTLNVTQDDAPVDGNAVMVSSTHASHAYMPGQASILDLLPGGFLTVAGGLFLYWSFGGKRWRGLPLGAASANLNVTNSNN
jgi:hypothetical protein